MNDVRGDPSGMLRPQIQQHIEQARELLSDACELERRELVQWRQLRRGWREQTALSLRGAFADEAVAEFLRVSGEASSVRTATDGPSGGELRRLRDAISLLVSLHSTLGDRGAKGPRTRETPNPDGIPDPQESEAGQPAAGLRGVVQWTLIEG